MVSLVVTYLPPILKPVIILTISLCNSSPLPLYLLNSIEPALFPLLKTIALSAISIIDQFSLTLRNLALKK